MLTAPYWSGAAISTSGYSFIVINGGANGTIQATANGTGLANQQDNGVGVNISNSSNVQVENLTVSNIYVHSCSEPLSNCLDEGGQNTYGIYAVQNSTLGPNIQVGPNNTVHDMKWCVFYGYNNGASNAQIYRNSIYHCDHGVVFGDSDPSNVNQTTGPASATCGGGNGNMICQNTIYDGGNWDDIGDANHHDGIHTWANNGASSYYVIIDGNHIYGNWGDNMGSLVYCESNEQAIPIINNLLVVSYSPIAGTGIIGVTTGSGTGGHGVQIVNNTIVGASAGNSQDGILLAYTASPVVENNIVTNTGTAACIGQCGSNTGTSVVDYNDYYNIGTANPFYCAEIQASDSALGRAHVALMPTEVRGIRF